MGTRTKSMSGVDAAWLHMEDPTNLMMVTGVAILDQPLDPVRVRTTIEERLLPLDRFRMRVVEGRLPVGGPVWEEDPYFDLEAHLHRIALPAPGGEEELQVLISDLASTPVDFSKPPWQMHLVENVMGGGALILRFHHCIGDGTSMNYVMYQLMDTERTPEAPPPEPEPARGRSRRGLVRRALAPARLTWRVSRKAAGILLRESIETVRHPTHLLDHAHTASDSAGVLATMLLQSPDPATPFKGALGVQKRVAWSAPLSLEAVKAVAKAQEAKINDVLVSSMAGALRSYLAAADVDLDELEIHAVVPVDLRPPGKAYELGNRFGLVFLGLPLSIDDPTARLHTVRGRMTAIKESPEAVVFYSLLSLFGHTPQTVEEQVVNIFGSRATAVLTNVAGPRQTLYFAGSRIEHMLFWVPQSGHLGMGISILSYDGEVSVGVITDTGLVPDPEAITDQFNQEFERLQSAVYS